MHNYRFLDFLCYKTTKILSYYYNNNNKYINQNNIVLTHFNPEKKRGQSVFILKCLSYGNILRSTYLVLLNYDHNILNVIL